MTERIQKTACSMRDKMLKKYGDELHHKHNKNHLPYRLHSRSHPCNPNEKYEFDENNPPPKGWNREFNLRKMRKRLDKGRIH